MKFLEEIAHYIKDENVDLQHTTIVLPSERAIKYLSAALFDAFGKPLISPTIVTMDRWVKEHEDLTVIDRTRALLKLFEVQLADAKTEEDRSFEEFLNWGPLLLSDFDEVDRYMVKPDKIFQNLKNIQEIEMWSFDREELTPSQKRFLEFWDRLPRYYSELNKVLAVSNSCYAGKAYRNLAENIQRLFSKDQERNFIFAGFNALSGAERSILKQLDQMGRAKIFMDADVYYLNNDHHEAGRFIRDLRSELQKKEFDFTKDVLGSTAINIREIQCPQRTGQVKAAASILASLSKEELDNTLLLLADESLIDAAIRNIPSSVGTANITLGLPIRNTAARTWIEMVFSIQENKNRFKTNAAYHKDVLQLWHHPFFIAILEQDSKKQIASEEIQMIRNNKIFLSVDRLTITNEVKPLIDLLFEDWSGNWQKGLQNLQEMNRFIYRLLGKEDAFDKAAIAAFDRSVIAFKNIVDEGMPEMSFRSFKHLFHQHWANKTISYQGNPIEGLQIMGLLETRTLDFERIICVGMNEGNLPSTNPMQTLIPMDLRFAFGLPTTREKQGLFAHHFYRLLHQCKELSVCYYSADEAMGSNEPSRYLLQIGMELKRINGNINIQKEVYTIQDKGSKVEHSIEKTWQINERIIDLLSASCSASMLKTFLKCPLDFYYKYVLEFKEGESVEEEIESNQFGTFIHDTLEDLYSEFARFDKEGNERKVRPITTIDVEQMLKDFPVILENKFLAHFGNKKEAYMTGKNLLSFEMAKKLTGQYLNSELAFLSETKEPLMIESLEREFSTVLEVNFKGTPIKVNLRGKIDRIDKVGEKVRIIDYKTGKVETSNVSLKDKDASLEAAFESIQQDSRKHILQLVQYAFLYYNEYNSIPESSIISFISNKNKPFSLSAKSMDIEELVKGYPQLVEWMVGAMLDDEEEFTHKGGFYSYCQYCN